ncbi:pyruvate dehydrogenase [acetyl-transferring]-phosphatase 1, mitochondrial [Parasteatoda tepidariorum]|uniref:pyruvate dehydrogenase [acetyl-transferring]-phosphatase 1, mitochondrial n=1 Tax=Parasteatoda tepidariorum TaxID=114398 RepID=UPI00077F92FA|nr:pyruvate dehydrogenase [acetyl-transferring]-phosphatase 1, mitochondrial [Parasteatoda tepidariorum]XP_015906532.1 pyruvate dehydrogenase [acetyl-transferring]-phosphatase 1, mitochondrial [Parasteatoda tepidariorum]
MAPCVLRSCISLSQAISWSKTVLLVQRGVMTACRSHPALRRCHSYGEPRLSPQEVSSLLRINEVNQEVNSFSVRAFEANQLSSNIPIEDRISIARCRYTTGLLFGVFDGHGGGEVAETLSHRLFDYIALKLLPASVLQELVDSEVNLCGQLIEHYTEKRLSSKMLDIHNDSLKRYAKELLGTKNEEFDFQMQNALSQAFVKLDNDISREIQEFSNSNIDLLALAIMGACACVAHIDGSHLHLATSGDCRAVLGILSDANKWICKPLGSEHNTDNVEEMRRVMSEHPKSEMNTVIKNERLLGQLAPLRAFGDYPYKWKTALQKKLLVPMFGAGILPPNYYTPPYLTAKPEVFHHHLTARDKFLILATDGLWEQMLPHKVVKFVGEHMSGKQTLDLLRLPRRRMSLDDINEILVQRHIGLSKQPTDKNAATHLIRNALGRTEYGVEHSRLSAMLSLPDEQVRNFRDDISVIVVFLDTDYLRHSPAD